MGGALTAFPHLEVSGFFAWVSFSLFPHRFANQATHFISAYREGLLGAQAVWANKKYHGHSVLPPENILEAKDTILA